MTFTPARTRVGTFRLVAQETMPYMGTYVYALIPVERPGIGTMAVDKYGRLYFDPAYVADSSVERGSWTVLHEALHLVFGHAEMAERIIGTAPTTVQANCWNWACDMVVNGILSQYLRHAPDGIITADRFGFPPKKTAIEYYHMLLKFHEQNQPQQKGTSNDTQDPQEDEQDDQQDDGDGAPSARPDSDDDGGDADDGEGEGEGEDGGGDEGSDGGTPIQNQEGKGGSCSDGQPRDYELPPDDSWEDRQFTMTADLESACEQRGWGSVPGELRSVLNARLRPQPDPFDVLRAACQRAIA